jgi:NAD(P)-dependent dehydrogenase (short-subunit alcohol dehydrogenase family)
MTNDNTLYPDLGGKVALITGAGSGIGKAAAVHMAQAGARIAVLGRTGSELEQTVSEIESAGSEGLVIEADISNVDEVQAAMRQADEKWNRLDIVFANAGINGVWAPIEELTVDEWKKTIDINLTGTFLTIKYAVPYLKRQGGSVIVTSSVNGTRMFSNSGASAYATSKAGQVALTKMLALELAQHRIRLNVICPGAIETAIDENTEQRDVEQAREPVEFPAGQIPLTDGKPGSAQQVAQLVLFLASEASSHITGTEIWIDGAQSLLQG